MTRESMDFDVVIVGGGPAGLSAAIRLAQLSEEQNLSLSICIIEKGSYIGAHILSGAVLEPRALNELIPNWQEQNIPVMTPATRDEFYLLSTKKFYKLPTPPQMKNKGNYIVSLDKLCHWLAEHAEALGVQIFPEFAATELIFENNKICGVITGDKGVDKSGKPTSRYQPGFALYGKQIILAEGCRGSLTEQVIKQFNLREYANPQTYGLGLKEVWEIPTHLHKPGLVVHSVGWPLDHKTYGGSFIYHFDKNLLAIGFVVGLDYQNPYLNPYEEFQRFKTHPLVSSLLKESKRIAYGARSLNEGGFQSIPKLTFPGGVIIGCSAGFLNVPKIKGIHTAMKSGMVAAESIITELQEKGSSFSKSIKESWIWNELHSVRNIRPAMNWGLIPGLCYAALETYLFRGKTPWTLKQHADYLQLKSAQDCSPIKYSKHDNKVTFDLPSSVFLTHSKHDENQPCHLKLKDETIAIKINLTVYASPETRYCPAGVYEIIYDEKNTPRLQINAANCIHCKACDIKDPTQNITWTPPEGGSGPQYQIM